MRWTAGRWTAGRWTAGRWTAGRWTAGRWIASSALALLLSGCGGGDDFTVSVKRSPDAVLSSLAAIDVTGPASLVTKPVSRTFSDGGIIQYSIPASDGYDDGIVRLTVSANAQNGTNVAVMVEVPAVKGYADGGQKVVAEDKVEQVLKEDLQAWAKNLESGNPGEFATARLEGTLTSIAIVLQNISGTGLMERGDVSGSNAFYGGDAGGSDWASADVDAGHTGAPMSDPDDDASYGEPMDDAEDYNDSEYDEGGGWGN